MAHLPLKRSLSRSTAAYLTILVALSLLLALTFWNEYRDLRALRMELLESELNRLRSHAERTVGRIERDLEQTGTETIDFATIVRAEWLRRHWDELTVRGAPPYYAAVVGTDGTILLHSDAAREGKRLRHEWYDRIAFEVSDDVVETRSSELASSEGAFDVVVPIELDGQRVADYHTGLGTQWFENWFAEQRRVFLWQQLVPFVAVVVVTAAATTAVFYLVSNSLALRRALASESIQRATEVGKLAAGLAHEIRNPLHAIQINLRTLGLAYERNKALPPREVGKILVESSREIDRIEGLIQQLLGFATPDQPRDEIIDADAELRAIVDFVYEELQRSNVELKVTLPRRSVAIRMDHGRFRQMMLNLLQNSRQAMADGGRITVSLTAARGQADIRVIDDGPGISDVDRTHIFEPFFSTKDNGTGLGLSLVKRFVDEANGEIDCWNNNSRGMTFRVLLEEVAHTEAINRN